MLNRLESYVYNFVKKNPAIKKFLRDIYQGFFSLLATKGFDSDYEVIIRNRCFFGFHDKSPWSPDGKYLLGHSHSGIGNEPCESIPFVEVSIFEGPNWTERKAISKTAAFNWQQGAQLQWLSNDEIIFNDFVDDLCVSRVVDASGKDISVYPFPVAALAPASRYFASICFASFGEAMPGYGYSFSGARRSGVPRGEIIIVSVDSGEIIYSLSRNYLEKFSDLAKRNSDYFISHLIFSPDASMLAFMVRLTRSGRRVESELLIFDVRKKTISSTPFKGIVSHYTFVGNGKLLLFASYLSDEGFYLFDIESGGVESVGEYLGERDGHPSSSSNGTVVYDTYPDRRRRQTLFIWRGGPEKAEPIASLYSPLKFRDEYRVDLHPRIKEDGSVICIDTSVNGRRSLATLRIP
tara:strand:- start:3416 stop:4636 length:1221 start_codon:yes stop_codon:yes gene_type:complete